MRRFAIALISQPMFASAVDHGPLVHWNEDPAKSTDVIWLEKGVNQGVEKSWSIGPAGFGYGDEDDATEFPNMRGNYDSIAIRREVPMPAGLAKNTEIFLRIDYDDGFVAWWNGREVARQNVGGEGDAMRATTGREAGKIEEIRLGTLEELNAGKASVIALQAFNFGIESSDLSLSPSLVAKTGSGGRILIEQGAEWEYLANAKPEDAWKTKLARPQKPAPDAAAEYALAYRAKGNAAWQRAVISSNPLAETAHKVFHAKLTGLPNGSDIEFRIAGGRSASDETFRFRMPPAMAQPLRFVTGGDIYHTRAPMDRMNRRAGLEDPLFALIGGDLAYTNDTAPGRWFDYFDSWVENVRTPDGRLVPKIVAIGNHEIGPQGYYPKDAPGPGAAREFFSLFRFPAGKDAAHVVDFGDWFSLVMLDSGHSRSIQPQTDWLRKTLQERREVPHLFACYHRPAYGAGSKSDATDIQEEWSPLFERFRVTAVFENDHHVFTRSHPIRNGKVDEKNGIPYLGAGAWSVGTRPIDQAEVEKRPWVAEAEAVNHLYVVETLSIGFKATAKGFDGEIIDEYQREWRR